MKGKAVAAVVGMTMRIKEEMENCHWHECLVLAVTWRVVTHLNDYINPVAENQSFWFV